MANIYQQHNAQIRRDYGAEEDARENMDELKFFRGAKYAIAAGALLWIAFFWTLYEILS